MWWTIVRNRWIKYALTLEPAWPPSSLYKQRFRQMLDQQKWETFFIASKFLEFLKITTRRFRWCFLKEIKDSKGNLYKEMPCCLFNCFFLNSRQQLSSDSPSNARIIFSDKCFHFFPAIKILSLYISLVQK